MDDLEKQVGQYISIHTPLAGSDSKLWDSVFQSGISIHTPLAGSDSPCSLPFAATWEFQSTLPLRGVTNLTADQAVDQLFQSTLPLRGVTHSRHRPAVLGGISIHTPLAGSDRHVRMDRYVVVEFQSTLPLRGVT